jgi:hypothetical protein
MIIKGYCEACGMISDLEIINIVQRKDGRGIITRLLKVSCPCGNIFIIKDYI